MLKAVERLKGVSIISCDMEGISTGVSRCVQVCKQFLD